jgi:hypothetical protein
MNFYVSADKYGLIRMGKKRAFVSYINEHAPLPLPGFGIAYASNDDRPTMREPVDVHRISLTTFENLTQDDAQACGYLYLHQLHEDLQKQFPEIGDQSAIRLVYFKRTPDLED